MPWDVGTFLNDSFEFHTKDEPLTMFWGQSLVAVGRGLTTRFIPQNKHS